MSATLFKRLNSSVSRHMILGIAGIALVFFIIGHLAGNFNILLGPEAMNGYAKKLRDLGPLLWVARAGIVAAFGAHILFGLHSAVTNLGKRSGRYAVNAHRADKTVATRSMAITGTIIGAFLLFHLIDFTFSDHHGPRAMVDGEDLGLYGVVWNAFSNPLHAGLYIVAVCAVGLHLSHAISSVCVTLGAESKQFVQRMDMAGKIFGVLIAVGYSSLPIYVLVRVHLLGG